MVDTPRTRAALLTLYADNASGDISAQDGRDLIVSLIPTNVFDVKMYGAVGDGTTDDSAACQAATTACRDAGQGTIVYPPGDYNVPTAIVLEPSGAHLTKGILISGYGARLRAGASGNEALIIRNTSAFEFRNFAVKGLGFYSSSGTEPCALLLQSGGASGDGRNLYQFVLEDIHAELLIGHGIHVDSDAGMGVFEFQMRNCQIILDPSATTKYGVWLEGPGSLLSSCDIYDLNARYGKNNLRLTTSPQVNIYGGSFLNAEEQGIYAEIQGGVIQSPHVESAWQSAANQAAGGGGIYIEGWCTVTSPTVSSSGLTKWGIDCYVYGGSLNLIGMPATGGAYPQVRVRGSLDTGTVRLIGIPSTEVDVSDVTPIGEPHVQFDVPHGTSVDNGDAAATLTVQASQPTQVWGTVLTADRAVTLSTTGAFNGARFHVVRKAAATGAFNLNVGTGPLKALAAGEWADVEYDGAAWVLVGFGSLAAGGGAPTTADYLVGTANAGLSAEIVVGTSPGGELGGTWGSPTVDATHAGGTHLALGTAPSTQAFGDSAAGGAATDASKTDHKHAMPANPAKLLFSHSADAGNVTTGDTDLYSDTIAAGQLANNGDSIEYEVCGVATWASTATGQVRVDFGGTLVLDSGAQGWDNNINWSARVRIVRVSSSVVRCFGWYTHLHTTTVFVALTRYTEVTGLTLANTQILKTRGQVAGAGAVSDAIIAKLGTGRYEPAP